MPPDARLERDRGDLVLPPNTYAYVLDQTKGKVSICTGPFKVSLSNTEQLVELINGEYRPSSNERAIKQFLGAAEGEYIVLSNPPIDVAPQHPEATKQLDAVDLKWGRKVNIQGPLFFPLWPGQTATKLGGHHLRNNQYLIVRVYDEAQAQANWNKAIVKKSKPASAETPETADAESVLAGTRTMGELIIVKGTDVSFFIPPTGIEVVPDENGEFVREAETLERLEYCILLNENGTKRYVQGPDVVFPEPTEEFITDKRVPGIRKFRALELNEHSGIYIKVIAAYDEGEKKHKLGDELFVTGKDTPIYFPRAEHSIIEYEGKQITYATAIPAGEGRYVLDRDTGAVSLVTGPKMYLPDPRKEVLVRRILEPKVVELLYPGNAEAKAINAELTVISNQTMEAGLNNVNRLMHDTVANYAASGAMLSSAVARSSTQGRTSDDFAGDSFNRRTSYSPGRQITLNTKYDGAVQINIWPGFAVMITDKSGNRRVEKGPKPVLLKYDETLLPMTLSTGQPKTTDRLLTVAYVQVENNKVSDVIMVETKDLVKVALKVSYRMSFTGTNAEKWFQVDNFVKFMTDHLRSVLKNAVKRIGIQDFYAGTIDIVRDAVLGVKPDEATPRPGCRFEANDMLVNEIEVLDVAIQDVGVRDLLLSAQKQNLSGTIQLNSAKEGSKRIEELEKINQENLSKQSETAKKQSEIALERLEERLAQLKAQHAIDQQSKDFDAAEFDRRLAQKTAEAKLYIDNLNAETASFKERMGAVDKDLAQAMTMLGDNALMEKMVQAAAGQSMLTGTSVADILGQLFKGTPMAEPFKALATRPRGIQPPLIDAKVPSSQVRAG